MPNNLQQREYYKIFSGHNQIEGYDKIHLGYQASTTEITFYKDQTTYFHYPFFSDTIPLSASTLGTNGGTYGAIPAMADRISKNLGGYGNNTPFGTPSGLTDGTWLCSWLYASAENVQPVWMDRYYNPGILNYDAALQGQALFTDYINYDSAFIDIPSILLLEAGVLYSYFHVGEQTSRDIVNTFAGNNLSALKLELSNFNSNTLDSSIYNNTVYFNFKPDYVEVPVDYTSNIVDGCLNFANTGFIDFRVGYNNNLDVKDEFSLNFDVNNDDWESASSSQLVGNYTGEGGIGIIYDNLKYFPFFVIPETHFGHLFYYNQDGSFYLDIGTQTKTASSSPSQIAINGDNELFVIDTAHNYNNISKYNHLGDIQATKSISNNTLKILSLSASSVIAISVNNTSGITGKFVYDSNLNFVLSSITTPYVDGMKLTYDIYGNMVLSACNDIKFDSLNQKWLVTTNESLYCNDILYSQLSSNKVQKIAIDPNNNLWVLHGSNSISVVNTNNQNILTTFNVGISSSEKNISFINSYNRSINTQEWFALILTGGILYKTTLDGIIININPVSNNLNTLAFPNQIDNKTSFDFKFDGDFTGYEWKRIFNPLVYNNKPQLHFKIVMSKFNSKGNIYFNSTPIVYKVSIPIDYFQNKSWHFISATYKNHLLSLYVDSYLKGSLQIPHNTDVNLLKRTDMYLGTPNGKLSNYNYETNTTNLIFNGYLNNIRLYNYEIPPQFQISFVRETLTASNLIWDISTADLQYIERIERFFKHKMPGSKSGFYRIKISGTTITDSNVRSLIEQSINNALLQINPANVDLINIEWI